MSDNIVEFFGGSPPGFEKIAEIHHLDAASVAGLTTSDLSHEGALKLVEARGFVDHVVLSVSDLSGIDAEGFVLFANGVSQPWTSFRCRRENKIIFAFQKTSDAILLKLHI